ncbi:hypothetical protein PSFL111601_27960 [Pseudomonas floridensis]
MAALRADQIDLLMRVVDTLTGLYVHKGNAAALIVGEVDEAAMPAQALFPRQDPAFAKHAVDGQVAGIEPRPLDRHQARQAEVDFVGDELAAGGGVDRITGQSTDCAACHRLDHVTTGHFTCYEARSEFQGAGHDGFHAGLSAGLDQLGNPACGSGHSHQDVNGGAQPAWNLVVHRQVTVGAAADEYVVRTAGDLAAAGDLVFLARRRHPVDEDVGRAFGDLDRARVFFAGRDAFLDVCRFAVVDVHVGRAGGYRARGGGKHTPYRLPCGGEQATSDACCKPRQERHTESARECGDGHGRNQRNAERSPDQESSQGAGV